MTTHYQYPCFARLEPRTPRFTGGRITETDRLTLDEAATFASKHAGTEITPGDFLRAAARGEITLRAIIHREAKLKKHDGGIYCNEGALTENTVPKGAIATLPLSACEQLESVGHASWRTFDGFDYIDDEWLRFTVATLLDNEPDFETVPTDCRVLGDAVHALADEYIDTPAAASGTPDQAAPPDTTIMQTGKGITKQQVMNAFEGIKLDRDHWSKTLASPPKWLIDCRVALGNKNTSALWNPALIAAALHDKGISLKRLDAALIGLRDWADEWGEVSAIFRD